MRRRKRPHHFTQKRPPVFVSAIEGFAAVAASKIDFREIFTIQLAFCRRARTAWFWPDNRRRAVKTKHRQLVIP
jgi:hypothetical protein